MSGPEAPRRPPFWRSSAFGLLAPSALLLVVALGWLGWRVQSVGRHLQSVRREAAQLQTQLINGGRGDPALLARLQTEANAARAASLTPSGRRWRASPCSAAAYGRCGGWRT